MCDVCWNHITAQTEESQTLADTTCDDLWFSILAFHCGNSIGVTSECMDISLGPDIPHLTTNKMVVNTLKPWAFVNAQLAK